MRKYMLTGLLMTAILFFFACDDSLELGLQLQARDQLIRTQYTDTVSITCSVVLADSVKTHKENYLLVGGYADAFFGQIETMAYTKIMQGDTTIALIDAEKREPMLDSAVIYVPRDYIYGDTNLRQTMEVRLLAETLEISKIYTKNDQLGVLPQKIASGEMRKSKRLIQGNDYWGFVMDKNMANELFHTLRKPAYRKQESFETVLLGLHFSMPEKGTVYGFDPQKSAITFFYRHQEKDTVNKLFSLPFALDNQNLPHPRASWFSNIKNDFSKSAFLKNLSVNSPILTEKTGNLAHIQAGTGVMTHLEFPHLKDFQKNKNIQINRAELEWEASAESFVRYNEYPPSELYVYYANEKKQILRSPTGSLASLPAELSGAPASAQFNPFANTYRSIDITNYVQGIVKNKYAGGLILASRSNTFTVNKLLFGDQKGLKPLKLRIYYTTLGQ